MIIRFVGKSLGLALAVALMCTAGQFAARGQVAFVDDSSHIPPSPASTVVPSHPLTTAFSVPAPSLANPSRSSSATPSAAAPNSAAYNLTRLPNSPLRSSRSTIVPGHESHPSAARPMQAKAGPGAANSRQANNHSAPAVPTRNVTQAGHVSPASGSVKPANHSDGIDAEYPPPVPLEQSAVPVPFLMRSGPQLIDPGMAFPTERSRPPTILGSHLGLQPGETATERSLRLMSAVGELERQVDALGQRNAELSQHVKQRDDQLLLAIREIRSARKDVSSARDELEHLRQQVKALQEKVHDADRDNAVLLKTMAPLFQKLLESDESPPLPDEPEESNP